MVLQVFRYQGVTVSSDAMLSHKERRIAVMKSFLVQNGKIMLIVRGTIIFLKGKRSPTLHFTLLRLPTVPTAVRPLSRYFKTVHRTGSLCKYETTVP